MSTAVTIVRAHQDKYKKDLDAVITFLTQYTDKRAPTPGVKVASVSQRRPAMQQKTPWHFQGKDYEEEILQGRV